MNMTVQQVIDRILAEIPGAPLPDTVDTLKSGDSAQHVTGIVSTFFASQQVIEQAIRIRANLIITHEPTFYNHRDETDWLKGDPVYEAKRRLLEENQIAVWRFHDYLHMRAPDSTVAGLMKTMEWESFALAEAPHICNIPPVPLRELLERLKTRLDCQRLRYVGEPDLLCRGIGILVGAQGGAVQIGTLARNDVDVLICGEINEWEPNEYVRDALQQGIKKALVIIGHAVSEQAGIESISTWLQSRLPEIALVYVPSGDPIEWS